MISAENVNDESGMLLALGHKKSHTSGEGWKRCGREVHARKKRTAHESVEDKRITSETERITGISVRM